jgi:UPF0176 protein
VTDKQRKRFQERQHQLELAKARGEHHLGKDAVQDFEQRRQEKKAKREAQRKANQ